MKKCFLLLNLLVLSVLSHAQVAGIDTIQYKGDITKFANIILVGDGYTAAQQSRFVTDAHTIMATVFNTTPWKQYANYFNVFAIKVISADSGVKHPNTASDCATTFPPMPVFNPNTFLGVTFDVSNIHRLLYPQNVGNVIALLSNTFPAYDMCVLLSNTPYYGGGGGQIATISMHASSAEIALHEIGHSFAELGDEYWAGANYAAEKPNMTQQNNAALVKWKNWLSAGTGVGIYQFTEDTTWHRPHQACKMRQLGAAYCSVCTEALIEKIHSLVNPVVSYVPATSTVSSGNQFITFRLLEVKPIPNTLKTSWVLNGTALAGNADSLVLDQLTLNATNTLTANVIDTTSLTRSDLHFLSHIYTTTWTINNQKLGIDINAKRNDYSVSVFPVPASEVLHVRITSAKGYMPLQLSVLSIDGKLIRRKTIAAGTAGASEAIIETSDLAPGNYTLLLKNDEVSYSTVFTRQ